MNLSKTALVGALAVMLASGTAWAQSDSSEGVQNTAFEFGSYYADDAGQSPSDKSAEPAPAEQPKSEGAASCSTCNAGGDSCGCNSGGDNCGCGCDGGCGLFDPCCKLGEPWKLFGQNECLKCKKITVAGWIAQSYTANPSFPADRFNGPVTWTDRANEYQLNQAYIYVERPTDTKGCGWDFGYRVDLMYGTDTRFTTESGLETRGQFTQPKWSSFRFYGTALPQAYAEVARDDVKVKIGHFYSPVGYEVVPTNANFFTTLPYTFQYGEPFTHTGVLATWKASEKASLGIGAIHGWDNFDNSTPNWGVIDTYSRTWDDKSALAVVQTFTQEPNQIGAFTERYLQTIAYTKPLDDHWTYVGQSDFGWQNNAVRAGTKDARWYGLNQYLFYKVSDCLSFGARSEWFRDEEGFRVGGFLGDTPGPDPDPRGLSTTRSGYVGNFYEVTLGANYKPNANTVFRPCIRFDWFDGVSTNGPNQRPFDGGTGNSQTIYGFDIVTTF